MIIIGRRSPDRTPSGTLDDAGKLQPVRWECPAFLRKLFPTGVARSPPFSCRDGRSHAKGQAAAAQPLSEGPPATPGGRPSGMTPGRITNLALKQAFRRVTVREGGKVFRITTFEAVIRAGGERQK